MKAINLVAISSLLFASFLVHHATMAVPTPTPSPSPSPSPAPGCTAYHTVVKSDAPDWCSGIAAKANITLDTFFALNPQVHNPSCDNLELGEKVCIAGTAGGTTATTTVTSTTSTTSTTTSTSVPTDDVVAYVGNVDDFCFFLPPVPGGGISDHEYDAIAFCTRSLPQAPNAMVFPKGFFTYKFYASAKAGAGPKGEYVQMTGQINITKYNLAPTDEGGQYDSDGAPPNATCYGYPYFVNLVEPANHRFCIRCCQVKSDCNFNHSKYGCPYVVPGNYGPGGQASVKPNSARSN